MMHYSINMSGVEDSVENYQSYLVASVSVVYWKVAQSLSRNYPGGCAQMI